MPVCYLLLATAGFQVPATATQRLGAATAGFQALATATQRLGAASVPRAGRVPALMLQFPFERRPPQEILDKLQPGWRKDFVGTPKDISGIWFAFEKVYGGREKALAASRKNSQVLLPIVNSAATILGAHQVLLDLFGPAEAADIIEKHPGILACSPSSLATTPLGDIRRTAAIVAAVDSLPAEFKGGIPTVTAFLLVGVIGTRTVQCGSGACSDASAWLPAGGFGPQFVRFVTEQVPHLFSS